MTDPSVTITNLHLIFEYSGNTIDAQIQARYLGA